MTDVTGRRRCRIPEHRRQIAALQRQQAALWETLRLRNETERRLQRELNDVRAELQHMRRWRFLWPCRWFGHRLWGARFGAGWCGRCGIRLAPPAQEDARG